MPKLYYKKFLQLICLILIIISINLTTGKGMIMYQVTWNTSRGSELKVDVTPDSASFQPSKIYSYTFSLTTL